MKRKLQQNADLELIKFHVICGDSIEAAIEKVRASGEPEKPRPGERAEKPEERAVDESLLKMRETIQRQGEQIQNLQEYLEDLKEELHCKRPENFKARVKAEQLQKGSLQ